LSEPLLRLARSAGHECGLGERVLFERADAQELPYEHDTFDVVINANMVHLVDAPIKMLNEIERVLAPNGHLFIADLRRSWLGLVEKEIRSGLTLSEAREMIGRSELRPGVLSRGLLWWRYEA
jgi:ubiquinone/menaquinone biosynthesis C-methylase UbiE